MYEDIKDQITRGEQEISIRKHEIRQFQAEVEKYKAALHILEGKKKGPAPGTPRPQAKE